MSRLEGVNKGSLSRDLRELTTLDRAHANVFNELFKVLIDNDVTLYDVLRAYTDEQIQLVTETGIPKLVSYRYITKVEAEDNKMLIIPLESFNKETDTVILVKNTVVLYEGLHYTVNSKSIMLTEGVESTEDPTFLILVLKNVPIGPDGSVSGLTIAKGTVLKDRLETAVQNIIDKTERELNNAEVTLDTINSTKTINLEHDSYIGVKGINGQTIVNLVPLFDSGALLNKFSGATIEGPNRFKTDGGAAFGYSGGFKIPVKPSTEYTLIMDVEVLSGGDYFFIRSNEETTNILAGSYVGYGNNGATFTTKADTKYIHLIFSQNVTPSTMIYSNVRLFQGVQNKPFVANVKGVTNPTIVNEVNRTSLTIPTTLYDGEYIEQNTKGELVKYKKWQELILDGKLKYEYFMNRTGFKEIRVTNIMHTAKMPTLEIPYQPQILTKYNGQVLPNSDTYSNTGLRLSSMADTAYFDHLSKPNTLLITISNTDSGWGQNYTPSSAEIMAYFLGWKMYDGASGGTAYNGTGTKYWHKLSDGITTPQAGTTVLPTAQAPKWQPYRLIYELATLVQEVIQPYGDLSLEKGNNNIKVYAGRIINESVKPQYYTQTIGSTFYDRYEVNTRDFNPLKFDTSSIFTLRENNSISSGWAFQLVGKSMRALRDRHLHDVNASYTVDYEPLNVWEVTAPVNSVEVFYTPNLRSTIDKLIEEVKQHDKQLAGQKALNDFTTKHVNEINPHAETANRVIFVGADKEFTTIQGALNSIKKNLGGRAINIEVVPGYHTFEHLEINGFFNGLIAIYSHTSNKVNLSSVAISDCPATISLQEFVITSPDATKSGVNIARSTNVELVGIVDTVVRDAPGVFIYYSANVFVRNSTFSNKRTAFKVGAGYLTESYNTYSAVKYVFEVAWGAVAFATSNYTGIATISDVYSYDGGRVLKQ